ncbi:MarR family winged helix-turn-helix transcriptional regulator [Microbacterium arabinogalactanolyticum]|uniref:MarR family winged helix-turn-helix transcriptional regulator n=1 Tax=Microbacterium arabinogalactanolyticum TaxID=69365 RepID=UPI0025559A04|nr:MarR family transcriptional regulator [Microbacterium arabinogalactanolyticum]GLC86415.1 MarR family transcriptional regulator [Microbacterium arabinogalactanolyticum]
MTEDFAATASELRFALFRLTRRLRSVRAFDAMSDAQLAALGALRAHGRRTLSGLAEHERVTAPTMSATVNGLEELGLVVRVPDEDDRRRVYVEITAEGEKVVIATVRRRDEALADMITGVGLDADELAVLRAAAPVLRKLAES